MGPASVPMGSGTKSLAASGVLPCMVNSPAPGPEPQQRAEHPPPPLPPGDPRQLGQRRRLREGPRSPSLTGACPPQEWLGSGADDVAGTVEALVAVLRGAETLAEEVTRRWLRRGAGVGGGER